MVRGCIHCISFLVLFVSCTNEPTDSLFVIRDDTHIEFNNLLDYNKELNPYTYRNFYNGSGVAIGDVNNDGLEDIYLTGNIVDNKLYKNLGDFKFEDVTDISMTSSSGSWSTGVSMVDINSDGMLDIYVCKAGPPNTPNRKNQLFINKGNFQFEDEAEEYGLDFLGLSIHASFFDFDRDGDLDCYLLNNSLRPVGGFDIQDGLRDKKSNNGNKLLVNENGKFIDKSQELGIYTSDIGFGLGLITSDVNNDGWIDIYVANDFFEKDYYYINQKGKYFKESGEDFFNSFALGSMGADAADIENDGDIDLMIVEMAPSTIQRKKSKAVYDSWNKYQQMKKRGYSSQLPRNMLQLQTDSAFIDISRFIGIDATEWSWAPLIFDMNNDGFKDLFISNGIGKDLLDRDYLSYVADVKISDVLDEAKLLTELIDVMPSEKVDNVFYLNRGGQKFEKLDSDKIMPPTFSNASAYLDNDGDHDMIIANVNDPVSVLENKSIGNSISVNLIGPTGNIEGIGARLELMTPEGVQTLENMPYRGFQSSVGRKLIFGLNKSTEENLSLRVRWPDGIWKEYGELKVGETNLIRYSEGMSKGGGVSNEKRCAMKEVKNYEGTQTNLDFNEFNKGKLQVSMLPTEWPVVAIGDLDADGYDDLVLGGCKDQVTKIMYNYEEGDDRIDSTGLLESFRSNVSDIMLFDFDNDKDLDIYLAHGGRIYSRYSQELNDDLYINEGNGDFVRTKGVIEYEYPFMTGAVASQDLNNDGWVDLIVAERMNADVFGSKSKIHYFKNNKGINFKKEDEYEVINVSSLVIEDINSDDQHDIVFGGEWSSITVLNIENGSFKNVTEDLGIPNMTGLWNEIRVEDLNKDGAKDIVALNNGRNNIYETGMKLFVGDFDDNGQLEQIVTRSIGGKDYPVLDFDDLITQLPSIKKQFRSYVQYSEADIREVIGFRAFDSAVVLELDNVSSGVYINKGARFEWLEFPNQIQYSSMHALEICDVNNDNVKDLLLGGNNYRFKPQYGQDDASRGWLVLGVAQDKEYHFGQTMSLGLNGEIRFMRHLSNNDFVIGISGEDIKKYELECKF